MITFKLIKTIDGGKGLVKLNKPETREIMIKFDDLDIGKLFVYKGFIFVKVNKTSAQNMHTYKREKINEQTLVEIA